MSTFNKLLNEALENTSGVTMDEFIKFATALVVSTNTNSQIPIALNRAMALSPSELTQIIKQVQFTGDPQALRIVLSKNKAYASQLIDLSKKVVQGDSGHVEHMTTYFMRSHEAGRVEEGDICPYCEEENLTINTHDSHERPPSPRQPPDGGEMECPKCSNPEVGRPVEFIYCENCDEWYVGDWYNRDTDTCENCAEMGTGENENPRYNPEGDYYNQGTDADGH